MFESCPSLEKILLNNNKIEGSELIIDFLDQISIKLQNVELDLSYNKLGDDIIETL
jgi:hypothetical protein